MICVESVPATEAFPAHIAPSASQPADVSTCTSVIASGTEISNPWIVSAEDGQTLAYAIVLVWIIAWSFRVLADLVRDSTPAKENE
jgi:hypothetical protein